MDCWAIIPAKPFAAGKSRLAALLGAEQRAALNRQLFGRVLDAVLARFPHDRVVVVTKDALLLSMMRGLGVHALEETGGGLNAALGAACRYAATRGAGGVVVLPCDLPTVTADDVAALLVLTRNPGCVIAPDEEDEGTNALALMPPDPDSFRFGPASFQAHLAEARARGMAVKILRRPGLARDLDTPEGYRQFVETQLAGSGVPI
jgi:2-phospho-L-lactate guanylyltransferase